MVVGICKFCGKEKELIQSHIIPKVLYKFGENGGVVEVDVKHVKINKEPLMCKECDTAMGYYDGYVIKHPRGKPRVLRK